MIGNEKSECTRGLQRRSTVNGCQPNRNRVLPQVPSSTILTASPFDRSTLSSSSLEILHEPDESRSSHQVVDPGEKDSEWISVEHPSDPSDSSSPLPESKPQPRNERASRTYTILSDSKIPSREVKIHVLPRETAAGGTIIARLTRQLVEEKIPPEEIHQEILDTWIRRMSSPVLVADALHADGK